MDNLEKEYNKRFQYKQSLNDDFDANGLWSAIEKGLDEEEDRPILFYLPKIFGSLILLSLAVVSGFWFFESENHQIKNNDFVTDNTLVEKKINPPSKSNPAELSELNTTTIIHPPTANKKNNSDAITKEENNNSNSNLYSELEKEQRTRTNKKQIFKKEDLIKGYQSPAVQVSVRKDKNQPNTTQTINESNEKLNDLKASPPFKDRNKIREIKPLKTKTLFLDWNRPSPLIKPGFVFLPESHYEVEDLKAKNSSKPLFKIGMQGGVNWSAQKFKNHESNPLWELRNESMNGGFGQSYGLDIAMLLKNKWIIQSGLNYNKTSTKFEYTKVDMEAVLRENQLLEIWVNGSDTLWYEYGNATVNRTITRKVIQYNQFQQISIPISFGMMKRKGNISYGISLGASLNFLIDQSGKRLDDNLEVAEFEKDSQNTPLDNFNLGLNVLPFVGYHLSDKIMLGLYPNWMIQSHGNISPSNHFQQVGLNLGTHFNL